MPLEAVIEFKRFVYQSALTELARYLLFHPADKKPHWTMPVGHDSDVR